MKVEVAVLGSPSLISRMVSMDGDQELCGSGGGRLGFPVPNSPSGQCGCKATSEEECLPACLPACLPLSAAQYERYPLSPTKKKKSYSMSTSVCS